MQSRPPVRLNLFRLQRLWLVFLGLLLSGSLDCAQAGPRTEPPRAAVFSERLPGLDQGLAREVSGQVRGAGYATEFVGTTVLTNPALLTGKRYELLVLPGARSLPMAAGPAIQSYLREGGDLLALGLPAWQSPLFLVGGKWMSRESYEQAVAAQRAQHIVEDFDHADLSRWTRSVGEPGGRAEYELAEAGGGKALHVKISHLGGWETLTSPRLARPFPPGDTLTCFRAKGSAHTRQLALEWREDNESRWIATVNLSTEWKNYTLLPDRFKAWPAPASGERRGHFEPQRAVSCCVGVALSHTALEGDHHEYWFDDLGTAANPFGDDAPPAEAEIPALESVSPSYQCFPITTPVVVGADYQKVALEGWDGVAGGRLGEASLPVVGLNPRARGVGFEQGRAYRWEPLLGAYDAADRDYRGALGALIVNVEPPFRGSVWAVFTPMEADFYQQPVVTNCLRQVLARMKRGVFLSEGGSEFFTVFAGQQFKAGARVVNFGKGTVSNLQVSVKFLDAKGAARRAVLEREITLAPGEAKAVEQDGCSRNDGEAGVSASLSLGGTVIDCLRHELGIWEPKAKPEFIEARDGGFWFRGKPWKVHGVNYMPSSGIGLANSQYFENWVGRGAYDPAVVERDLRRIKAMNLNAVSVFIHHESLGAQHLLDLLRRCEALGLHVNQSLRPGTPMDFQWRQMKELIEYFRLAQNDTVFAYDLAWEPSHGGYSQQEEAYAGLWNQWVTKRYGSVPAAEKVWGVLAPREQTSSATISVPPMTQLTRDGEWRKLVADYRLFLDDVLRERYSAARRLVKSIDPHHAVSFRMSNAGDPLYNWDAALPYDFYGLADAVDVWEPEAYGRIGDWERVRAGDFTAAYARLCDARKPLIWAEMGYNAWDMNRMASDPEKLAFEGRYYADFYRMMIESGADGVFFWWYPGGFRLGENSDFGIINPDGTDRPVTKVIRSEGERFLKAGKPPQPDYWIAVDRDRDARGLLGNYEAVKDDFWKTMNRGRRPGLKWAHEPGGAVPPSSEFGPR
jgi:hypothetical protein